VCLGIPGQIVDLVDAAKHRAVADVDGVRREISIALVGPESDDPVALGDWVLIHVGFAMAKIDEAEATETLNALRALGQMYEEEIAEFEGRLST
jgi:hydrogenase expression/formation protein HypC